MSKTTNLFNNAFQVTFDDPKSFIGQGGMGTVYRGYDTVTKTPVAVKVLKPDLIDRDAELIKRFQLEGETLRQLNHPNIVKMLGADEGDHAHYLIMEYVSGGSLRDLLDDQKTLTMQRALYIALDLADALTRAHRLNILHRDIKPANVLIAEDGTPRLTDFGMARVTGTPQITQDGAIVGTMAYLAPEAFQGEQVNERADIWAFGIMLWEMLIGERPFPQDQPAPLIQAIVTHPLPDLEKSHPELPTALVDLIYRMLDKNPASRIPSARLIGAELEAIIRGGETTLQPIVSVSDSTGRFDLETTEFPAPKTGNHFVAPNNLQHQPTPFVGREKEIKALLDMLSHDASLITLTGPGGIGKSRISIELAQQSLSRYEDGVYAVSLHSLDDARNVVSKIGDDINFTFGGGDLQTELSNYLREKHMLLILDNFETVMEAADLVSHLVANAPRLTIVVTSRERLRLRGEQVFDVDTMTAPSKRDESLEKLAEFAVVKLFLQSAKRALPSFELNDDNSHHVAEIIRLVGGLPLGVELAAGWLEMLPIDEIVQEIQKSLDFLETDLRDVPERHRSLRAVADYSWNLLNDDEREIFLKLSIFRNGFEREAAQKVAGASLRNLTNLVNKSLITREPTGRYYIHKLLRQYGEERFKDAESGMETHMAFADYYITLVTKLYTVMQSSKEGAAFKILDQELDNVRYLWRMGQSFGKYEKVAQLHDALFYYYLGRSMFVEGAELFGNFADAMKADNILDAIYWQTRTRQAFFVGRKGSYEPALALALDALNACKNGGAYDLSVNYLVLGNIYMFTGDYEVSAEMLEKGIALQSDSASWYYPAMHSSLGYLRYLQGDLRAARSIYEDLTAVSEKEDYAISTLANIKNNFGEVLLRLGDYARALKYFNDSLKLSEDPHNPRQIAVAKLNIAGVHFMQSNYEDAKTLYQDGYDVYREIGDRWGIAQALSNLGNVAMVEDDHETAHHNYNSALTIRREIGEKRGIADSLSDLAYCAMTQGEMEITRRYMQEVLEIRREIGDRLGEGEALTQQALSILLSGDDVDKAVPLLENGREIAEETGSAIIWAQAQAGFGEVALAKGNHDEALHHFRLVLSETDVDEAPLTMILWALLGIAFIKVEHGDFTSALQMVTLILRYPQNYINIIETRASSLLATLMKQMPEQDVETTTTATKSVILRNYIRDLLAQENLA